MARNSTPVGERLAELLRDANRAGLRWRAIPGVSESTMSAIANDPARRMADDTAYAIDDGMGWQRGTAWALATGDIAEPVPRNGGGGSLSLVGGIGQARPHQRGADRGEELVASERDEIAAALVRIGQELVALGQRVADGPPAER